MLYCFEVSMLCKTQRLKHGTVRKKWCAALAPRTTTVLRNNCNHYTDAAAKFLCGPNASAPPEVMEQVEVFLSTPMGRMLQPMIENMMSGFSGNRGGQSSAPISVPPGDTEAFPPNGEKPSLPMGISPIKGGVENLRSCVRA